MVEQQTSRFWSIWESCYIEELNRVPSNTKQQYIPKIGDTVLMPGKDLGFRKGQLTLGLITAILDISQMFFCLKYATESDKTFWFFLYKNIEDHKPISVLSFENPVMGSKGSHFLAINSLHKISEQHPDKLHLKESIDNANSDNLNM